MICGACLRLQLDLLNLWLSFDALIDSSNKWPKARLKQADAFAQGKGNSKC